MDPGVPRAPDALDALLRLWYPYDARRRQRVRNVIGAVVTGTHAFGAIHNVVAQAGPLGRIFAEELGRIVAQHQTVQQANNAIDAVATRLLGYGATSEEARQGEPAAAIAEGGAQSVPTEHAAKRLRLDYETLPMIGPAPRKDVVDPKRRLEGSVQGSDGVGKRGRFIAEHMRHRVYQSLASGVDKKESVGTMTASMPLTFGAGCRGDPDIKYLDINFESLINSRLDTPGVFATSGSTSALQPILFTGTDQSQRVGRKVVVRHVDFRFMYGGVADPTGSSSLIGDFLRVMLVIDHQRCTLSPDAELSDVIAYYGYGSEEFQHRVFYGRNMPTLSRFTMLTDDYREVAPADIAKRTDQTVGNIVDVIDLWGKTRFYEKQFDVNVPVSFDDANRFTSNAFQLFFLSSGFNAAGEGTDSAFVRGTCRFYYYG